MNYVRLSTNQNATRYAPTTKAITSNVLHGFEPTPQSVTSVAKENEDRLTLGLLITSIQEKQTPYSSLRIVHAIRREATALDEPPSASSGGGVKLGDLGVQSTPAVRKMRMVGGGVVAILVAWPKNQLGLDGATRRCLSSASV